MVRYAGSMDLRQWVRSFHDGTRQSRALIAVPFVLIAVVTVVDVTTPPQVQVGPFLVAAPALTATFAGPRLTALVGGIAVLAQGAVAAANSTISNLEIFYQIIALVLISAIVTFFAHLREHHSAEMVQLRSVAEAAQRGVLRPLPARSGPLRMASVYLAAEAGAQLGGDLYATARTTEGTRVIVGDVRGKGLDAISGAAGVLGAFRALARQEASLTDLAARLDNSVAAQQIDSLHETKDERTAEDFVTATVLEISHTSEALRLVSCGHPPPLILRSGRVRSLDVEEPAPPLGIGHLTAIRFTEEVHTFGAGDTLLLYTDGVTEARDRSGRFYPLAERLAAMRPKGGPELLLKYLCADLLHYAGGHLGDDAAMVAIERLAE